MSTCLKDTIRHSVAVVGTVVRTRVVNMPARAARAATTAGRKNPPRAAAKKNVVEVARGGTATKAVHVPNKEKPAPRPPRATPTVGVKKKLKTTPEAKDSPRHKKYNPHTDERLGRLVLLPMNLHTDDASGLNPNSPNWIHGEDVSVVVFSFFHSSSCHDVVAYAFAYLILY